MLEGYVQEGCFILEKISGYSVDFTESSELHFHSENGSFHVLLNDFVITLTYEEAKQLSQDFKMIERALNNDVPRQQTWN